MPRASPIRCCAKRSSPTSLRSGATAMCCRIRRGLASLAPEPAYSRPRDPNGLHGHWLQRVHRHFFAFGFLRRPVVGLFPPNWSTPSSLWFGRRPPHPVLQNWAAVSPQHAAWRRPRFGLRARRGRFSSTSASASRRRLQRPAGQQLHCHRRQPLGGDDIDVYKLMTPACARTPGASHYDKRPRSALVPYDPHFPPLLRPKRRRSR